MPIFGVSPTSLPSLSFLSHDLMRHEESVGVYSVVQARAQSPKPAELSPSCQSCRQVFTGPRAWALIFGSLRPRLQALGVYTDEFSVIFIVEGLKEIFNHAISLISVNINELFTL